MSRTWESLAIGSVLGGGDQASEWGSAINRLSLRVMAVRGDVVSPLALNIVFHVPGVFIAPDYEEPRTGKLSKKDRVLMVQVPLPDAPVPADVDSLLIASCRQSIDLAERFAMERGLILQPLTELRTLVAAVEESTNPRRLGSL